jgi:hypothetical protein
MKKKCSEMFTLFENPRIDDLLGTLAWYIQYYIQYYMWMKLDIILQPIEKLYQCKSAKAGSYICKDSTFAK